MSKFRFTLTAGMLGLLLVGGTSLARAQSSSSDSGSSSGVSQSAVGEDGSRRNDTNYERIGALCDSLQSALELTDIEVVPVAQEGDRTMKRFDEAAFRQTMQEMFEALGIEGELPARFTPDNLSFMFTSVLVAAAESTPSVQTLVADGLTASLAILRGAVTDDGNKDLMSWGFKLGTDSALSDSTLVPFGAYQSFLDTSAQDTGAFQLEKTGLARYTTYYYAAWAENENGIAHGDTLSFMTPPELADGFSLDTSLVTATSATLELSISDAGGQGPDDVGFYWDDADFTLDAFEGDSLPSDSASGTAHSVQVTGLTRMTTYYFNAYADNLAGRAWADEHFAFTTKPEVPEFDTLYADLTVDSLYALLADDGGQTPSLSRFIYSTTSNAELVTDSVDGVLNGLSFSAPIASASLLPSQDYDLNAFTENSAGRVTATPASFFTPALAFTGDSVANITDSTASLMASFTFGNRMPDAFGFKWGLAADLSDATESPVALAADSTIRLDLDGLSKDSTYYYAAYADNGTVQFGDTLSFLAMTVVPPTVLADTALYIASTRTTVDGSVDFNGGAEVTGYGFIWGTDASLADATEVEGDSTSATGFGKGLLGLEPETTYYYAAFATNAVGTGYSDTLSFTTPGTVTFDGFTYSLVKLDTSYWFVENLRNTHFANGDEIPHMPDSDEWSSTFFPAYSNPAGDDSTKVNDWGRLYNYYTYEDTRGICPTGWHPASYSDLNGMRTTLDLDDQADYRSSAEDSPAWDGTNRTGFSALPAGARSKTGDYTSTAGYTGSEANLFWVSLWGGQGRAFRMISTWMSLGGDLASNPEQLRAGYSIRCVQGAPNTGGDLPLVTTSGASDTTAVSISLTGVKTDDGQGYVSALGFAWSTDPGLADPQFVATHTTTAPFTLSIEDLEPSTTYYYAAFGRNGWGTAYGDTLSFTTGDWICGLPVTYNEVEYETVELIDECWFAENLATVTFANGDSIPVEASDSLWQRLLTPAMTIYGIGGADEATNFETYGPMYNYMVVNDARGICPTGWHVPASDDWFDLKNSLNDPSSADEVKAADAGGTNETGLTVLMGGVKGGWTTYSSSTGETRDYSDRGLGESTSFWSTRCQYCTEPGLWTLGSSFSSSSTNDLNRGGYIRCMLGDAGPPEVLPAVILEDAATVESLSANSMTISFEVAEDWGAEVYEAAVRVGTSYSGSNYDNHLVADLSGDSYTVTIDSLNPVTIYWYKPYVRTIDGGYSDGYHKTVTTPAGSPALGTSQATAMTYTGATLNGAVSATGGSDVTSTGFKWATNENMTGAAIVNAASTTGAFTAQLTGLTASTTYYYQAFATNAIGTSFGPVQSFSTLDPVLPTITTSNATNVDSTTAKIYGLIGFDGGDPVTAAGFVWGSNADLSGATDTLAISTSGNIMVSLSDLTYNSTYYYSAYATNGVGTAYGDTMSFVAVEPPFLCGSSQTVSYDGHEYETIHYGGLCWFTENLRTEHYANGDPITMVTSGWNVTTTAAMTPMDNDVANVELYGWLYNWHAVAAPEGLCPTDWHVPTRNEWLTLEDGLGASVVGLELKSKSSDTPPWNGNNSIGFSALPGGYRSAGGTHTNGGVHGYFWTSTESSIATDAFDVYLYNGQDILYQNNYSKRGGLSVRCVMAASDTTPSVSTEDATYVTRYAFRMNGNILARGGVELTERGFIVGSDPSLSDGDTLTVSVSSNDSFYKAVNGLETSTTMYYRAYASNEHGTTYGDLYSVTTLPAGVPGVSTYTLPFKGDVYADLRGSVVDPGGEGVEVLSAGFYFSSDASLSDAQQVTTHNTNLEELKQFTAIAHELTPNTTYYYTAFATNSFGTAYGDTVSFVTTSPFVPGSSTVKPKTITYGTVQIGEQVWLKENLYAPDFRTGVGPTNVSSGSYSVWTNMDDTPASSYYTGYPNNDYGHVFNAYVVDDLRGICPPGWHVPSKADFVELRNFVGSLATELQSSVMGGSDDYGFSVLPAGFKSNINGDWIRVGQESNFWTSSRSVSGGSAEVLRLAMNSDSFEFNAEADKYGASIRCLKTKAPLISSAAAENVTGSTVALKGFLQNGPVELSNMTSDPHPIRAQGFIWGTDPALSDGTEVAATMASSTELPNWDMFELQLSGLTPGTTYYFQSFATNDGGKAYGEILSFTTAP